MKNPKISLWPGAENSAEAVLRHAAWRQSRGRQPSLKFGIYKDPRKALALACTVLRHIPSGGMPYSEAEITTGVQCPDGYAGYYSMPFDFLNPGTTLILHARIRSMGEVHAYQVLLDTVTDSLREPGTRTSVPASRLFRAKLMRTAGGDIGTTHICGVLHPDGTVEFIPDDGLQQPTGALG